MTKGPPGQQVALHSLQLSRNVWRDVKETKLSQFAVFGMQQVAAVRQHDLGPLRDLNLHQGGK